MHRVEGSSESNDLCGKSRAARGLVGAGLRVDVGSGLDEGALGREAPQGVSACDVVGGEESVESGLVLGPDFAEDSISGLEKIRFGFRIGRRERRDGDESRVDVAGDWLAERRDVEVRQCLNVVAAGRLPPVVVHSVNDVRARKVGEDVVDASGTRARHALVDPFLTIRGDRRIDIVMKEFGSEVKEDARRDGVVKGS